MLGAFANAFRTPDLRRKLLFVLLIIVIFRLGSQVPTPGVQVANVQACIADLEDGGLYSLINLFSGGALLQLTIFALGIMPYITASIILQLLRRRPQWRNASASTAPRAGCATTARRCSSRRPAGSAWTARSGRPGRC